MCLVSVFFLFRPLTRWSLFPYTTLFRSLLTAGGLALAGLAVGRPSGAAPVVEIRMKRDRKSTRLNSSHVEISYAVFCLKKKKDDCGITKKRSQFYYNQRRHQF